MTTLNNSNITNLLTDEHINMLCDLGVRCIMEADLLLDDITQLTFSEKISIRAIIEIIKEKMFNEKDEHRKKIALLAFTHIHNKRSDLVLSVILDNKDEIESELAIKKIKLVLEAKKDELEDIPSSFKKLLNLLDVLFEKGASKEGDQLMVVVYRFLNAVVDICFTNEESKLTLFKSVAEHRRYSFITKRLCSGDYDINKIKNYIKNLNDVKKFYLKIYLEKLINYNECVLPKNICKSIPFEEFYPLVNINLGVDTENNLNDLMSNASTILSFVKD